jgi:hypothetical protein
VESPAVPIPRSSRDKGNKMKNTPTTIINLVLTKTPQNFYKKMKIFKFNIKKNWTRSAIRRLVKSGRNW